MARIDDHGATGTSGPSSLGLVFRRGAFAASDLEHDLGVRLPRPGLSIPWELAGWDTTHLLSRGLAGLRASLLGAQLPGHSSIYRSDVAVADQYDDTFDLVLEGHLVLPFRDGVPPEGLPDEARHALISLGYFTHLNQVADYLECALMLASHGYPPAAVISARSAIETAWRLDTSLSWICDGSAGLERDRDVVTFAMQGQDRQGRDTRIGFGIGKALESHWRNMTAELEAAGGPSVQLPPLERAVGEPGDLYPRLSEYAHPTARALLLHWGWSIHPNGRVQLPYAGIDEQARIRRVLVQACIAATVLADAGRERWLSIHEEVPGLHLHRQQMRVVDQAVSHPEHSPQSVVMTLKTTTQSVTEDLLGERLLDGMVEQAAGFISRATTKREQNVRDLALLLLGRVLALRHLQLAVQNLAAGYRLASAGAVARTLVEHAHLLGQVLHESDGAAAPVLLHRLRASIDEMPERMDWVDDALRDAQRDFFVPDLDAADEDPVRGLRRTLNDLVHPNQMARLLSWGVYVRPSHGDGDKGAAIVVLKALRTGGPLAEGGSSLEDGFARACDALAYAVVLGDRAIMRAWKTQRDAINLENERRQRVR